eukprot:m.87357 g.87357  ORF g.87357 m.87357 type:complete len:688 (+) comp8461_c0_seq1:153-2216(+)
MLEEEEEDGAALVPAAESCDVRDADSDESHSPYRLFGLKLGGLQRFLRLRWFMFWLCAGAVTQSMLVSGLVPVNISTIEKRFGTTSTMSGLMISFFDLVIAGSVLFITFHGHTANRFRIVGLAFVAITLACMSFVVAHLAVGRYNPPSEDTDSALCNAQSHDAACSGSHRDLYPLFLLAEGFLGVGSAPMYTLGTTLIDDNVPPERASFLLGVFLGCSAVGPAIGFLLGGVFLGIYVDTPATTELSPESAGWIGAWWLGFVFAGLLATVVALAMSGYPKNLPNTQWIRDLRKQSQQDTNASRENHGLVQAVRELLRNKPFVFSQLGIAAEMFIIAGVGGFLPKYVETMFSLSAADASFYSGISIILGASGGTIFGGWLAQKCKWTTGQSIRFSSILAIASLIACGGLLIHCPSVHQAGVSVPYPGQNDISLFENTCLANCSCDASVFRPVCGDGLTYISACFAGCTRLPNSTDDSTGFAAGCGCLSSYAATPDKAAVSDGLCEDNCNLLPLFLFLLFVIMFITFSYTTPTMTFTIRCVSEKQRSLALGVGSVFFRIFGAIPGPLVVGSVLDKTCSLWETKCDGSQGSCWFYDNSAMRTDMFTAMLLVKICSVVCFGLAWWFFREGGTSSYALVDEGDDLSHIVKRGSQDSPNSSISDQSHSPDDSSIGEFEVSGLQAFHVTLDEAEL